MHASAQDEMIPAINGPQVNRRQMTRVSITCVADILNWEDVLRRELFGEGKDAGTRLDELWFRGTSSENHWLVPGIYRRPITRWATEADDEWLLPGLSELQKKRRTPREELLVREHKRLNQERDMMQTFERECGSLLEYTFEQQLYFLARHHGMPSRRLDWSINPLVALFMCVFPEPKRPSRGDTENTKLSAKVKTREKDLPAGEADESEVDGAI